MDTNLKKGKLIRAFVCKMIAVGALIGAIGTGIMGREVAADIATYGPQVVSGKLYDLPAFREYMSKLYHKAMVGYAGAGDDYGYPLTDWRAQKYAQEALADFDEQMLMLNGDILFHVRRWVNTESHYNESSNLPYPVFSEHDGHMLLPEDILLCCYWNGSDGTLTFFGEEYQSDGGQEMLTKYYKSHYQPNQNGTKKINLMLAVKKDCTSLLLRDMEASAEKYQYVVICFAVFAGIWLIFSLCSIVMHKAVKKGVEEYAKASGRVYLEIKLILFLLSLFLAWYFNLLAVEYDFAFRAHAYGELWMYFPLGCFWYLVSVDIRQNKGKIFLQSLPAAGVRHIMELAGQKPWYKKAMRYNTGMLSGGILLVLTGAAMLVLCLVNRDNFYYYEVSGWTILMAICGVLLVLSGVWLLYCKARQKKLIRDMAAIADKLSEIKSGSMGSSLQLSSKSLLYSAANDVNELKEGIERAVEEQNRSNRMRVELITNVSHDLKTPLTSIINYADLLCEEELQETAAGYAKALQEKAYRLKNMVQDVFDLSKATSGNLKVETATIDLVKLIKQTLADMDERIQKSNLTFKLNVAAEPLLIEADGEKLYRVFQNLFVNALQYSLDNSRVHIQLSKEEGYAVARVKNTSLRELDFDTSEIVERFVRADSSRTTEGSGLGLSIVQSFVEACGGEFGVETDADMFTAHVRFLLSQKQAIMEQEEETKDTSEAALG